MNSNNQPEILEPSFSQEWIPTDLELHTLFRLAIYGSLTRKFIHEINNSLTGIIGYSSLVLRTPTVNDKEREYINRSLTFCQSARTINETFLNLFPSSKRPPKPVTLNRLLQEMVSTVKVMSDHQCSLRVTIDPTLSDLSLPELGLRETLLYLFIIIMDLNRNACEIQLQATPESEPQEVAAAAPALHLTIRMTDSPEPSPVQRPGMESLFFNLAGGLNDQLALAIADRLLKSKGGWIETRRSQDGNLLGFHCRIPLTSTPTNTPVEKIGGHETAPHRLLSILLLEDQELIAEFIQSLLESVGHQVRVYRDGLKLSDDLSQMDFSSIDVFLLDVFVPHLSGVEIAHRIRSRSQTAPLVFCSALADMENISEQFPGDAQIYFLRKPFQKEELLSLVEKLSIH